ncbi:MAG TPA: ATP-grasp domain-containing protein, partial [Rhodopila sp.]|uniref:ATP-grasp domain-containing protein n=1 Tax=Rhodopila sp. TaxID=2480087 RepID=UPI002C7DD063
MRTVVEQSVGPVSSFPTVRSRHALLSFAARVGVLVPDAAPLTDQASLDAWIASHPMPLVLKADGSWAGFGVRILSSAAKARSALASMQRPIGLRLALREAVLEGDRFALRAWMRREPPALSVQSYIDGWPANIGVACWKGEILAFTCAEAVATESATGPSTVARIIDNPDMVEAARKVVSALGLSGLIGFDFMIEAATGNAYMIEMNPRNTPICAVRLNPPHDLAEA